MEDYLIEKLAVGGEKRKDRLRNLEWLGSNMMAAGQELTPGDTYGSALIKSGQTQLKIGQIEREFAAKADRDFIKPLKKFLDEDAKALTVSRRQLTWYKMNPVSYGLITNQSISYIYVCREKNEFLKSRD